MSDYNVVVKLEPLSISMGLAEGHFDIKAKIKFTTTEALDDPGIADYLKNKLTRMTRLFGSTADRYETGSDHYISGVRVNFIQPNGGKRKRTRRRKRKYKCQTHINIPVLK